MFIWLARELIQCDRSIISVIISVLYGWQPLLDVNHSVILAIVETLRAIEVSALPGAYLIDVFPSLLHIPKIFSRWKKMGQHLYEKNTSLFERMIDDVKQSRDQVGIDYTPCRQFMMS